MDRQLAKNIDRVRQFIKTYPDFPTPGNSFQDIYSILENPEIFGILHEALLIRCKNITPPVECITAVDTQGFIFGPLLALSLKVPFVPICKKGSLPGNVTGFTYKFETCECGVEIPEDTTVIKSGTRVVLVDAILGYGKYMAASCQLLKDIGAEVVECLVVLELLKMRGRNIVPVPVHSLLQYPELVLCCIS